MLRKAAAIVVAASVAMSVAATLASCGQKGPLYVPGIPKGTPWPYPDPPKKAAPPPPAAPTVPGTADPAQ